MRVRHHRTMFELSEVVPLFMPIPMPMGGGAESERKSTLHFTFNCSSDCIRPELRRNADFPHAPLILTMTVFLIKRTGEIIRPVKEFYQNHVIVIRDYAPAGEGNGGRDQSRRIPVPDSPPYRPLGHLRDESSPPRVRRTSKRRAESSSQKDKVRFK